jgi:hypothetical protein
MANKKQISLSIVAVVFATAMIASFASTSAFAADQSISQSNDQSASSTIVTAGSHSDVDRSGNIFQFANNDNDGGNANVELDD